MFYLKPHDFFSSYGFNYMSCFFLSMDEQPAKDIVSNKAFEFLSGIIKIFIKA